MTSSASAWLQVQKGAVRCTCGSVVCLSEPPSVSLDDMALHGALPTGLELHKMDAHDPARMWSPQAQQFCRALCEAYPGMEMTAQLLERRPVYVYPHEHGQPYYEHISASGQTMMSSETSYALFRHRRWVHPDYLALDDGEICERVAKRMRVQQRAAERAAAGPVEEKPAPKPMIRDDVSVADSLTGGMPTLTTHVSSATMLRSKLGRKNPAFQGMVEHNAAYCHSVGARRRNGTGRLVGVPHQWNQSSHDRYFNEQHFQNISCGGLVCEEKQSGKEAGWYYTRKEECLRCKMGVAAVPELMRQARAVMGGDCWEDGLTLTFDIVYKGPQDPRVNVRVTRGEPVPPVEAEAEAEAEVEGPTVEGFGDDEL